MKLILFNDFRDFLLMFVNFQGQYQILNKLRFLYFYKKKIKKTQQHGAKKVTFQVKFYDFSMCVWTLTSLRS